MTARWFKRLPPELFEIASDSDTQLRYEASAATTSHPQTRSQPASKARRKQAEKSRRRNRR